MLKTLTVQNLVEGLQRGLVADHNLVSCNQRCLDYARAAFAEDPSLQADFGTPEALVSYLKAAAVKGASTKAQVVAQYPQVECQEATDPAMVRIAAAIGNQSKPLSLAQLERALGDGLVVALSELRERPAAVAARIFATALNRRSGIISPRGTDLYNSRASGRFSTTATPASSANWPAASALPR